MNKRVPHYDGKWYRAREVAEMIGVHPKTIYRWVRQGKLKAIKIGNRTIRFTLDQITAFANIHKDGFDGFAEFDLTKGG